MAMMGWREDDPDDPPASDVSIRLANETSGRSSPMSAMIFSQRGIVGNCDGIEIRHSTIVTVM